MKLSPAALFFAPVLLCGLLAAGCAESLGDGLAGDLPTDSGVTDGAGSDAPKDSSAADTGKADTGKIDTGSAATDTGDDSEFPDFDSGTDDAGDDGGGAADGGGGGTSCMVETDCPSRVMLRPSR